MPDANPRTGAFPSKMEHQEFKENATIARVGAKPLAAPPQRRPVNILPLAVWEAIAFVQGQYGVPDKLLAQVAQCGKSTLVEKRAKYGWKVRSLPEDFDKISDGAMSAPAPETIAETPLSLEQIAEKIMLQIASELAAGDADDFDAQTVKRVAILSSIAKTALAHAQHKREAQPQVGEHGFAPPSAEETSAILHKIGKRVNELAAKRADDLNRSK